MIDLERPHDEDAAAASWAARLLNQGASSAWIDEVVRREGNEERAREWKQAKERAKSSAKARRAAAAILKRATAARAKLRRERAAAKASRPPKAQYRGRGGDLGPWMLSPGGDLLPEREPLHVRDVIEAIREAQEAYE